MEILKSVQSRGQFLKMKDGRWMIVAEETARQKIAHAIQYQIRNDFSQQHEHPKPCPVVKQKVQQSGKDTIETITVATLPQQRQSHSPRSQPTSRMISETQIPLRLHDSSGFRNDPRLDQLLSEGSYLTNEVNYQQWFLEHAEENRGAAATATASNVYGNSGQRHASTKDYVDPQGQNSRRSLTDQIDYATLQGYPYDVGSHYVHLPTINAMAYDLLIDHQHTVDGRRRGVFENSNRKTQSLPDHIDSEGHPHFGTLLNDNKIAAPPEPIVHSLDVSGVSQWDGSVSFLENAECVDGKNDETEPIAFINFKQQGTEQWTSYPNQNNKTTSFIDTGLSQRQQSFQMALNPPPRTKTRNDTVLEPVNVPTATPIDATPMDTLVRAASDFSRDDSWE